MCQLIVTWHTCSHLILSNMKCPFDGATTHDEETTTASLVDYPCWLCKQGPNHPQWEKVERLRSNILTVEHLETILSVSSYDGDFLARVAGFYARGDHKRWGQPGEDKARYSNKDSYIVCLELEVALAARGAGASPMRAGLMFDLEFLLAKRFDMENMGILFWPLRGWRAPSTAFYSCSSMLELLPGDVVGDEVMRLSELEAQFAVLGSMGSNSSGSSSAISPYLCQTNNTSTTSFPDLVSAAPDHLPSFGDVVPDWTQAQAQWKDSDTSASSAQGPFISDPLFGFDPHSLHDAMMSTPDLYPQMIEPSMSADVVLQPTTGLGPYPYPYGTTTAATDSLNPLYHAGTPVQTQAPDPSPPVLPDMLPAEVVPVGYTTPIAPPRSLSRNASATASMSPMSPQCYTERRQQQQQQHPQQTLHQQAQTPQNLIGFGYGSPHQFLSASIPLAQAQMVQAQAQAQAQVQVQTQTYQYQAPQQRHLQQQVQAPAQIPTAIPVPSPITARKMSTKTPHPPQVPRSSSHLFSSHGRPDERYLMTPLRSHSRSRSDSAGTPSTIQRRVYKTPKPDDDEDDDDDEQEEGGTSEKTRSTTMDTDVSSPSPSARRARTRPRANSNSNSTPKAKGIGKPKVPMAATIPQTQHALSPALGVVVEEEGDGEGIAHPPSLIQSPVSVALPVSAPVSVPFPLTVSMITTPVQSKGTSIQTQTHIPTHAQTQMQMQMMQSTSSKNTITNSTAFTTDLAASSVSRKRKREDSFSVPRAH